MQTILRFTIALIITYSILSPSVYAQSSEQHSLPKSKIELNLKLLNEGALSYSDRLVTLTDTALDEFTKFFGGLPKKIDGSFYDSLTIELTEIPTGLGGEADPEIVELRVSDSVAFGFYNWEIALIHEIMHLWSAETFRYIDDQEQWFNEGVTEYLTFRLAAKLGIINKDDVVTAFSIPIANYLSAKGIGEHSLRSAGSTDELKKEHYFLVYQGGFVAGMILDHQIRSKSNGKFSLDDLMLELYKSHSREKLYSSESILALIKNTMGVDFNDFFEKYIYGNQIMPVGQYFDIGMLPRSRSVQQVLSDMLTFE